MIDTIITEDTFDQELQKRISNLDVKYAKPDDFKTDGDNPNSMTETQLNALEISVKRFGTIVPIVCDQNMVMVDGEQRLTIYRRLGVVKIPYVQINLTDSERRILRQTLNKLKGSHDYALDLEEYAKIIDSGNSEGLKSLLAFSDYDMNKILFDLGRIQPDDLIGEKEGNPFQIIISFKTTEQLEKVKELIKPILDNEKDINWYVKGGLI